MARRKHLKVKKWKCRLYAGKVGFLDDHQPQNFCIH